MRIVSYGVITMNRGNRIVTLSLSGLVMMLLILDAQTALAGAKEGITLCLYSVIPSLFPFFVVSVILTGSLTGQKMLFLRPLGKLCGIPHGAESLFLLGLLGGYPVGAQSITNAYRQGQLEQDDARRLLGFCSNAGPAFLFGMIGPLFSSPLIPWVLWLIHILSAMIVGMLLPNKRDSACKLTDTKPISLPHAVERSLHIMANVCGWIIVFRVILAILNRWILWIVPAEWQALLSGLLELSNGCHALRTLPSDASRFIISSAILGCGGLCVGMQTISVTEGLGTGLYFPGKLLQSILSIMISILLIPYLFHSFTPELKYAQISIVFVLGISIIFYHLRKRKKVVALCE